MTKESTRKNTRFSYGIWSCSITNGPYFSSFRFLCRLKLICLGLFTNWPPSYLSCVWW